MLARTALPSLLLWLAASLIACDHGSVPSGDGRSSASGSGGSGGAVSSGGSLASGGTGIVLTPPSAPCQLPATTTPVFSGRAVLNGAPARRELFTWTTAEQAAELRAGSVLMTRTEREGLGPGFAMAQLQQVAQSSTDIQYAEYSADTIALAKVFSGPDFAKARYAWSEPWATRAGWPGEDYGDQLVRILLREDAWIARFDDGGFNVFDMNNHPVLAADALAQPERLAGVYFVRDSRTGGPRCGGSFSGGDDGYRELIIGNEAMIEEWSLGTPEIRARLEADAALLEEFFQRIRPCPASVDAHSWNLNVVCSWSYEPDPRPDEFGAYHYALAIPSANYLPQPAVLVQLVELLKNSLFEPDPFVVRPGG
jgi:hypothetical protein